MWLFSEVTRILKQSGGGVVEWEQGWRGGLVWWEWIRDGGRGGYGWCSFAAVRVLLCLCVITGGRKGSEVLEQKISLLSPPPLSLSVTGPDVKQQQFVRFHSSLDPKKALTALYWERKRSEEKWRGRMMLWTEQGEFEGPGKMEICGMRKTTVTITVTCRLVLL